MPIYFYWGEDDFAIEKAVTTVRDRVVDPQWASFNYTSLSPDEPDAVIEGLNHIMTPPFGFGGRLVWLVNSNICQQCPDNVLAELQRTLPAIPENSLLLFTSSNKPDERLKSTKLLKKFAEFREFSLIPPWKTELLVQSVNQAAQTIGVKLTTGAVDMLVDTVGNNTRLLYNELEKLRLYAEGSKKPLSADAVGQLVTNTTHNSLQLAGAIKTGDTPKALVTLAELLAACEPPLRIVATLTGQFRTWLWIKIMMESGERNQQAIAQAVEVSNPNRIYYLQKEVNTLSVQQLVTTLPILLELEVNLKQGASETITLQTKVIELCQVFQRS